MARIRTVKPELWSDPEFVECSSNARLLLVAGLNFASDYGVLADKPKQLKMQCFPADSVDIDELIDELIDHDFWVRCIAPDGSKVLVIRTFTKHQKVDKPTPGRWGDPSKWAENSPSAPRALPEDSPSAPPRKGREGKGSTSAEDVAERAPDTLFTALVQACGWSYDEMTTRQRRACGVARAELIKVGATPEEIHARARRYREKMPHVALTPNALASNWAGIAPAQARGVAEVNGAAMSQEAMKRW